MKILYVLPGSSELPAPSEKMAEAGLFCHTMRPSLFSALTAMQIASEAGKCAATHVRVSRLDDAMAAVSARKLAKSPFKIVMEVEPCTAPPRRIPRDILAGVDAWIFPDQSAVWPDAASTRVIIMPPYGEPLASLPLLQPAEITKCRVATCGDRAKGPAVDVRLLWIGPIDGNYDRLLQAIDSITPGQQLRICGTGKARHTMPLVRRSRVRNEQLVVSSDTNHSSLITPHSSLIAWLGEEYNLDDELSQADAIIQSGPSPTLLELRATSRQTPLATAAAIFSSI